MKFPNHILLDVSKLNTQHSSQYWIFLYLFHINNYSFVSNYPLFFQKFFFKKEKLMFNPLFKNQKKYTIKYNLTNPAVFLSQEEKEFYKKTFEPRLKVKHRVVDSQHYTKKIYDYLINNNKLIDQKLIRILFKNFNYKVNTEVFKNNKLWNLFDINFIRKEKIYTKLKYSRVPQYDIVSGGSAALFAGFLGFLISEKFGFELADSGDFYYLFMYGVLLGFGSRIYLKLMNTEQLSWGVFSFKWLILFFQTILSLIIKFFKALL